MGFEGLTFVGCCFGNYEITFWMQNCCQSVEKQILYQPTNGTPSYLLHEPLEHILKQDH